MNAATSLAVPGGIVTPAPSSPVINSVTIAGSSGGNQPQSSPSVQNTRCGLCDNYTFPIIGTIPTVPIMLKNKLPYALTPGTLTVDPGTAILTAMVSNNGTIMTGGSITAAGTVAVGTITAPGTCVIGSNITIQFTNIIGVPNGSATFSWRYASP